MWCICMRRNDLMNRSSKCHTKITRKLSHSVLRSNVAEQQWKQRCVFLNDCVIPQSLWCSMTAFNWNNNRASPQNEREKMHWISNSPNKHLHRKKELKQKTAFAHVNGGKCKTDSVVDVGLSAIATTLRVDWVQRTAHCCCDAYHRLASNARQKHIASAFSAYFVSLSMPFSRPAIYSRFFFCAVFGHFYCRNRWR